jgi:acetyl esterase/lipase
VRERAKEFGINPHRVGVMGFSAGGHLASTAATHYDRPVIDNTHKTSLRPDFQILGYPVISFTDSLGHLGSRDNLLGKNPTKDMITYYSGELQVSAGSPPCFLVHAKDDDAVKVGNSLAYQSALIAHGVPCELHLFEKGGHGFGMINPTSPDRWMDWLKVWLQKGGWLK